MSLTSSLVTAASLAVVFVFLIFPWLLAKLKSCVGWAYCNVPGPKGHWLYGNTYQLGKHPSSQLQQWAEQYGELFSLRFGTERFVYVNSREAVKSIFDKQSSDTSCKGPLTGAGELVHGMRLALMPYGKRWRKLRAIVHKLLTPKVSATFRPSQEFEAKQLVFDLLKNEDDRAAFYRQVKRFSTSVIVTSIYGARITTCESNDVEQISRIMEDFSETTEPGIFVTDRFPLLGKLPIWMQWWRSKALEYYRRQYDLWMRYWAVLENLIQDGKAPACFAKQLIEDRPDLNDIGKVQASFLAGTMIEAGSETTASALNTAILYLASDLETQRLAAREIDLAIGDDQSPSFDNEAELPLIKACIKEVFRIRPLVKFGPDHYVTKDVIYKDHMIPKGTHVFLNICALHFDPEYYEEPQKFQPSRYLAYPQGSGFYAVQADPKARDHYNFGAGRRICPGIHLAESSLFIALAKILWAFEIRPILDAGGSEEKLDTSDDGFEPGANTVPKPFKVRFVPRSPERADMVTREWARAKHDGYQIRGSRVDVNGVIAE